MKTTIGLILLSVAPFSWADPRPVLKSNLSQETVTYPELQISLVVPAGSALLGIRPSGDAQNYIFPWLNTSLGQIDFAFAPQQPKGTLEERVSEIAKGIRERNVGITLSENFQEKNIGGIPFIRVEATGDKNYKIVRYYFITTDRKLAFLHLHGSPDLKQLESLVENTLKRTEQGAGANG